MKRIVYTIAVGRPKFALSAIGLARSLNLIGDQTRRVVVTDQSEFPWAELYDDVLPPTEPFEWTMLSKLTALKRTDADQVLFIDSDCLAFKRLDYIFDHCAGKGLCVQGNRVTGGVWYGSVSDHLKKYGLSEMPQFNGGLIYYERTVACEELIEACFAEGRNSKTSGFHYDSPLIPEEPYLSISMAKAGLDTSGVCHLIDDEMDFMDSATGLIGKLELDVLRNRCAFVCRRQNIRFVQPAIFHASRYINFTVYWKQLDKLAALENYAKKHPTGYMSPAHRLRRSIERRYLKLFKRIK